MTDSPAAAAGAWTPDRPDVAQPVAPQPPVARAQMSPSALASQLSARLCHDFVSPASAIVSGLDLLEDPTAGDMRADAMNLIATSARKLVALLAFSRVAFGASTSAETFDTRELETLTRGVFAHVRPELDWKVEPASLSKAPARALLNLAQIGAGALPTGGVARVHLRVQDGEARIGIGCEGARARLRPEVAAGLRGEPLESGLGGHWVQAFFTHQLIKDAGGALVATVGEERVILDARLPA